ncbi:hypothetical protein BLNAU_3059 [Blattamonas nauphoetae]|uniref:Uncharacterized protein n=1 Tax=Blattamonas nauphoetae TaxID=2049346 RepID=A0ABQ9YE85_9EUKA|nr:hypothetical protein BLNAU_3059 [Blattamonas nauphoetae]
MPPKHKFRRKLSKTQSNTRTQYIESSKSDENIAHSTILGSCENDNESSLDLHSIPSATDEVTITANDRQYVRVSKQILQNELKRKRMNVESLLEQALLEGDEISLPTSTPSDWRVILQDSITLDDLREGYISLFEQVNSEVKLTQNEVFHAVRFLEYTTIHIEHREYPHNKLIKTNFREKKNYRKQLMSALLKLVCHPSETLRTVSLSFLAASLRSSSDEFRIAVITTGLLRHLFEVLKPHEIPLNRTTFEFHRHFTSIVDVFLDFLIPEMISRHLKIEPSNPRPKTLVSEIIDPISRLICAYLRYLVNHPISPTDYFSGLSLVSNLAIFDNYITRGENGFANQDSRLFFVELRKNMTKELASSLNLAVTGETLQELLFGKEEDMCDRSWLQILDNILLRLSEGRHLSDLGLEAFLCFLSRRPDHLKLDICSDGTYSIKRSRNLVYRMHLPSNPFCTLFNTTRLHNSVAILEQYHLLTNLIDNESLVKHIWNDWFSSLFHTLTPSTLPFTNDFLPLHNQLVDLMNHCLVTLRNVDFTSEYGQIQSEPCHVYNTLLEQTKEYIVHLSLHPFSLISTIKTNIILDFFERLFRHRFENSVTKPFREKLRKEMDEAALSSSSPPFILTSNFVCYLTNEEILNVVDRIVALLESDSPISDDTILRICAFHTNQLEDVYLPELFRKAGRSTEQYLHAFECLLSLPVDNVDLRPVNSLLTPKPKTLQPTLDEWEDLDLLTVGIVMRRMDEFKISIYSDSDELEENIRTFVIRSLPQARHSVVRLNQPRLEQLLAPSIDFLGYFLVEPGNCSYHEKEHDCHRIIDILEFGDQRVIAECFSRIGFFSRIVCGVLDARTSYHCECVVHVFLVRQRCHDNGRARRKMLRNPIEHFLEEGWQDVLEFILVKKKASDWFNERPNTYMEMMRFHGANLDRRIWLYDST